MQTSVKRPKYLNLIKIRLPIPGIVSIAHRISGVLMFLAIPLLAYLLHLASSGESGFMQVQLMLQHPVMKLVLLVLSWSIFHHLFAGIRYLLIDMDVGVDKPLARASAAIVFTAGLLAALLTLVVLL
jgi:succinate dehydrogenase / fumarate reductase cytochrome b subunit